MYGATGGASAETNDDKPLNLNITQPMDAE